jgi:anaerobic selenocysteine-containing dehydrogenase
LIDRPRTYKRRARGPREEFMERVVHRTCTFCEASCAIRVHLAGGRITGIRGDELDPLSRGYICSKAQALADLHEDPDRLRHPMRRGAGGWEKISWDRAFDCAADGIARVQRAHGGDAAALYLGEPVTHNLGATLFADSLAGALGTRNRFSASSLDQMPKQLASHWMYGSGYFLSVPDVDRTDHLLIIGANPVVSNGSLLTAPGMRDRLRHIRERGGRVVLIDPRRSETAKEADEHHFIRPGTDPLLLAALVGVLIDGERVRLGELASHVDGLETLRGALGPFTPEAVADRVGIPAQTIRSIAVAFSESRRAVCYGRMGPCVAHFGTCASWLIEVLNLISGNLDRAGGSMFPNPAVDVIRLQPKTQRDRWRSRTRGTPEFMGELPAATLADEIERPGPGQVRALVTLAGNPVLSSPAGHQLSAALAKLEFMLSIDFYRNETTRHANLILPPVGPLERDHFDLVFQLFAVRNVPRWSAAVFRPPPDTRSDAEILLELVRRLQRARGLSGRATGLLYRGLLALGADRATRLALDLALRTGPHGAGLLPWSRGLTLAKLRAAPHGIDLGPMKPCLPERLPRKSKKIELAPPELIADLARLRESMDRTPPELVLIGRREARSVNSWSHNLPSLVSGRDRCLLEIHPDDAAARGIEDGAPVRVKSRVGSVQVPAHLSDALMPGVVSLPHGYGHRGEGIALGVAAERAGASANDLTDPAEIDPLSGNAVLNGVPVSVEPADPSRGGCPA